MREYELRDNPLPNQYWIGNEKLRVKFKGQVATCWNCNSPEHMAKDCEQRRYWYRYIRPNKNVPVYQNAQIQQSGIPLKDKVRDIPIPVYQEPNNEIQKENDDKSKPKNDNTSLIDFNLNDRDQFPNLNTFNCTSTGSTGKVKVNTTGTGKQIQIENSTTVVLKPTLITDTAKENKRMLSQSDGEEEYNEDMTKHKVHVVEIIGRADSDLIPARGSNVLVMEVNGDFQDIGKEVPAGSIESEINYEHLKMVKIPRREVMEKCLQNLQKMNRQIQRGNRIMRTLDFEELPTGN